MQRIDYSIKRLFLYLSLPFVLTACGGGGSSTVKYYLIDPVEVNGLTETDDKPLSIDIIDLRIPQYLERFHIASRSGENRLQFSSNHQWGESLRKNLLRTMARNLSRLLATSDVATPLNRSSSVPDYRLLVHIEEFERGSDDEVILSARWQITANADSDPTGMHSLELQSGNRVGETDYAEIVTTMQTLYGQLGGAIADSIIEKQKQE